MKFLAELRQVGMGKILFRAGIPTMALHKGDVERIAAYLMERKMLNG